MVWQPAEGDKAPLEFDKDEKKKVGKKELENEQLQFQSELLDKAEVPPDPPKKKRVIETVFDSHKGYKGKKYDRKKP